MKNKIRIVAKYPTYWDGVVELPEGKTANDIEEIVDKWGTAIIFFRDHTEMEVDLSFNDTETKHSEEIWHEEHKE